MSEQVTGEQVRNDMMASGINVVNHHECSICAYMTIYFRQGDQLYFDPGCECTGRSLAEPRDWDEAADWINMQSNAEVRARLKKAFGMVEESDE